MTDLERYQDPLTIQRLLRSAHTIAIVGLSPNELRASNFVGLYLKRHGYRVIPVNPRETEILGEVSYPSLSDVPVPVDIVNVFRAPDALPAIAASPRKAASKSSWTAASRSSMPATSAECTGSASTRSESPPSATDFSNEHGEPWFGPSSDPRRRNLVFVDRHTCQYDISVIRWPDRDGLCS